MKKLILILAIFVGLINASAQSNNNKQSKKQSSQAKEPKATKDSTTLNRWNNNKVDSPNTKTGNQHYRN